MSDFWTQEEKQAASTLAVRAMGGCEESHILLFTLGRCEAEIISLREQLEQAREAIQKVLFGHPIEHLHTDNVTILIKALKQQEVGNE